MPEKLPLLLTPLTYIHVGNANSLCRSNRLISAYILQRLACSKHCQLDLPGFKNLEGLHIGMFLSAARGNGGCGVPQTLVYNDESAAWERDMRRATSYVDTLCISAR